MYGESASKAITNKRVVSTGVGEMVYHALSEKTVTRLTFHLLQGLHQPHATKAKAGCNQSQAF